MVQATPYPPDFRARDRLEKALRGESQRIRQACFRLTHTDPEAEPRRSEALVLATVDALERQTARGAA